MTDTREWLHAVNAVALQEDYVKSLERRIAARADDATVSSVLTALLASSKDRLIQLRTRLKEIDEGE